MTSRNGHPWTDIDDAELRSLTAAGEQLAAIARKLGRTSAAVKTRWARLGPHRG